MSNKEERMNRNKSIIEDYKNGKPILEIAREYNLSETMCYKILKGTQEPPRYFEKKRKRLTTRNEQIVKQYKGGMTARELGKMYGISMQRIYAILHSSGEYESQKYNHIETALKKEKKMRNQTFLDAYKKNPRKSIIELSREVNISPSLGYLMSGDTTKLETRSGTVIASGYNRIVIGDYGAFVEFSRAQANARHLKIKEGQSYRIEDPRYAEHVKYLWLTADDNSDVKVYDQKRLVEYADYKPGMLYVSVYEVFPAGEGH